MWHSEICVVCADPELKTYFESLSDDRYGFPGEVTIVRCRSCKHFSCSPKLGKNEIKSLYEEFYGRIGTTKVGVHRTLNSRFWRWVMGENNLGQFALKPDAQIRLLDVGSGDCQNLWDAAFLGFDSYGFDVDRTSEEIGKLNHLRVLSGDSAASAYVGKKFDFIQLNQVIEHFIEPALEIEGLATILSINGSLFISTPNSSSLFRLLFGKRWINWHVPYHQHHFSKKSLRKLLEDNNWVITKSKTVTPLVWVSLQLRSLRNVQETGVPNRLWTSTTRKRYARLLDLTLLVALFFPVRFLDLLKLGDCQTIIARRRI